VQYIRSDHKQEGILTPNNNFQFRLISNSQKRSSGTAQASKEPTTIDERAEKLAILNNASSSQHQATTTAATPKTLYKRCANREHFHPPSVRNSIEWSADYQSSSHKISDAGRLLRTVGAAGAGQNDETHKKCNVSANMGR